MGKLLATVIKDFGKSGLVTGQEVLIKGESSFAYKIRYPSDLNKTAEVICFVPKDILSEPKELEATHKEISVPSSLGETEKSILDDLMSTGLIIGSSDFRSISTDSGVKKSHFVAPPTQEETEVAEKETASRLLLEEEEKEKQRWKDIRLSLAPHKKNKLKEGSFWLTDLTQGVLPKSGVNHRITSYPFESWDAEEQEDIPKVNVFYHWDADMLEAIHLANTLNSKILITGLPGTGKTTAIQQYAAHIQQPYMRFNGKDGIEQSSFLGYPWATKNGMEWKDGVLPQGMKLGYLVCLDEVFKIPAGIQMAMQGLYEKNGTLMLDDKPGSYHDKLVVPKDSFRLMLTDNVRGTGDDFEKFASTQIQDSSTLDRFDLTYELGYLPFDAECDMLRKMYPKTRKVFVEKLVKFAGLVREGYAQGEIALTLSPRGLFSTLDMMSKGRLPLETALDLAFTNKIADDTELTAILSMKETIGDFKSDTI